MKESLEVVFLNELDVDIFDEYFYKSLLNSIVNLLQQKSIKRENEIMTCPCLEQVDGKNAILTCACHRQVNVENGCRTCACHRQVEDKSFGRRSVNENSF